MSENSLAGKRIVITRAREQSGELSAALANRGATVLPLPLVAFAPPEDWSLVDEQLRRLHAFDAILFLSANSVRYVLERAKALGVQLGGTGTAGKPLFIAAVGPATARALAAQGTRTDYVAREHTGQALAGELRDQLKGRSVLLPRSDRGNEAVPQALREVGANVTEFVAYRNTLPENIDRELLDRVRRADVDAIVFASPSALQNFVAVMGTELRQVALGQVALSQVASRVRFAAIGPTTAQALRDAGLPVAAQSDDSSAESLASALSRAFEPAASS